MKEHLERFGIPTEEALEEFPLVRDQVPLFPYSFAKKRGLLPLEERGEVVVVAMADPFHLEAIEEARLLLKKRLQVVYAPQEALDRALELCYHHKKGEAEQLFEAGEEKKGEEPEEYDLLARGEHNPIIRMVNTILMEAIQQGASDIHFEPTESGLSIRYRIDGVLQPRYAPSRDYQGQLLTRLKVMARLDIAEHRLPQDGRIKLRHGGREIDFRVSTLPIIHGERIVLRILDKGNVVLGLDRIGMDLPLLASFRRLVQAPEGIVLVTGPTGSGKTTTLYSAISEINAAEMNVMTIEDPVEYKLSGISQMSVHRQIELDFAKGLRHILRQDPDVVMIGEIRDKETAEIAIQASLTGHLVLSTLHTNDAPSALTRLSDMGIEPYLLASSILGVLAQRLLRKICPACKKRYRPSSEELRELGLQEGVELCYGEGCPHCFGTGYKGRHGIYELMAMTGRLKAQVLKSQDAQELKKVALGEAMETLFQKGVKLLLEGVTTSQELLRVTRMEREG